MRTHLWRREGVMKAECLARSGSAAKGKRCGFIESHPSGRPCLDPCSVWAHWSAERGRDLPRVTHTSYRSHLGSEAIIPVGCFKSPSFLIA